MDFSAFYAIFCYSFILTSIFYDSQFLFVEAIIHLRKTICHIPNLRNINDSSHPKYVSEMKKKVFVVHFLCFIHFSLEVYGIRMYRIYTTTNRKRKRAFNTRFFLSSTIYASLVTSWLCWRWYSNIVHRVLAFFLIT